MIANVVEVIIVQSLYSTWKDEEVVNKRLRDLTLAPVPVPGESIGPHQFYQNNAFEGSVEHLNATLKRASSTIWNVEVPNNLAAAYTFEGYPFYATQSEFDASVFVSGCGSDLQLPPAGELFKEN